MYNFIVKQIVNKSAKECCLLAFVVRTTESVLFMLVRSPKQSNKFVKNTASICLEYFSLSN